MIKEELKYKMITKEGKIIKGVFKGNSDELKKSIAQTEGYLIFLKEESIKKESLNFKDYSINSKQMKNI